MVYFDSAPTTPEDGSRPWQCHLQLHFQLFAYIVQKIQINLQHVLGLSQICCNGSQTEIRQQRQALNLLAGEGIAKGMIAGSCLQMCPAKEQDFRQRISDIDSFERVVEGGPALLAVKKFARNVSFARPLSRSLSTRPTLSWQTSLRARFRKSEGKALVCRWIKRAQISGPWTL